MKLTIFAILAVCLLAAYPPDAMAGDYHTGSTLKCNDCHVTHGSMTHGYDDDRSAVSGSGQGASGSPHLLKQADTTAMCMRCHDGSEAVDVYGAVANNGQPEHRSAGCFNSDASGTYAPFDSTYGHDLKNSDDTAPGGSGSQVLGCVSCHDPHGNQYYRNLKDLGNGGITYAKTANDANRDVFELKPYPSNSVADAYDALNISYNLPEGGAHRVEGFCLSCHPGIHSKDSSGGSWTSHPTSGHSRAYTPGTLSPLKTLGGSPIAGGSGALMAGEVSCVTCHKAHGSTHPFGLIYDNRTTTDIEDSHGEGVSTTCKHCHDQGLTSTE